VSEAARQHAREELERLGEPYEGTLQERSGTSETTEKTEDKDPRNMYVEQRQPQIILELASY
jgi:hypothetical protein